MAQTHFVMTRDILHQDKVGLEGFAASLEFFEVNFSFAMPRSVARRGVLDKPAVETADAGHAG